MPALIVGRAGFNPRHNQCDLSIIQKRRSVEWHLRRAFAGDALDELTFGGVTRLNHRAIGSPGN